MDRHVAVSRQHLRHILTTPTKRSTLKARREAVQRLHDDLAKLVRWPALCESLRQDIDALREAESCAAATASRVR